MGGYLAYMREANGIDLGRKLANTGRRVVAMELKGCREFIRDNPGLMPDQSGCLAVVTLEPLSE